MAAAQRKCWIASGRCKNRKNLLLSSDLKKKRKKRLKKQEQEANTN